jgi:DNA mismatch endonuclease, patch repair protein
MDTKDKAARSKNMAAIRSTGNHTTELAMIRLFKAHRITGWRRGWPLRGKPDFVWLRTRVALFVDGCYWHHCPTHGRMPEDNRDYWERKFQRNQARDRDVSRELKGKGWTVLRIWEHDIKNAPNNVIRRIRRALAKAEESRLSVTGGSI